MTTTKPKIKAKIKAKYTPKLGTNFCYLDRCKGQVFEFEHAYTINNVKYYSTEDKNFPSSTPISEEDLTFDYESVSTSG